MLNKLKIIAKKILHKLDLQNKPTKSYDEVQAQRVAPWFADNGDKTLRLNYRLNDMSIVFDLGGYEGQWASDIYAKYRSKIYVFEPMPEYASNIEKRFLHNPDIRVFRFGLAEKDKKVELSVDADASSSLKNSEKTVQVELRSADSFIAQQRIKTIHLMKINIEGGEYDLLDSLISSGNVNKVKNIQVQFHDFFPEAEQRMLNIQKKLRRTHRLTYQYPFVWENWERK